jgi:WS/DGAT/MGAT family acyltransferase
MAPATPFNASVTNQRAFAGLTLPLAEAKRIGKAHGASVNDVVLWLCSSALRSYLMESRELPQKPLVAAVPVSLRAEGDVSMNTQATMSLVDLGTQIADPLERLRAIMAATASMKNQIGSFRDLIPTDFPSIGAPWLMSGLASLYGRSGLADRLRFANVTVSNVPGVQVPLYLAGAKMLDYYPVSIVAHGIALNITVQSYMGQLCFGLIACRRAVPDVRDITVQMQRAFEVFKQLPQPADSHTPALPAPTPVKAKAVAKASKPARAAKPRRAATPVKARPAPVAKRPKLRVVATAPTRARAARQSKAG